ncbi:hypothetical protein JWG44_18095 [Leptospira sp. 201903071]|uniref:hypothetical protein n=1 Tax=Leptospira ainazelensis TaxID=2810034 RepID=UPI0019659E80|nr:hypothetical protein [Leptospira ainazelensis]MBM9502172.1 hypothetical protein [Leptospira ainazelensis]
MTDYSFLTLFLTTLLGFGSLFGFLHLVWKQLFSQLDESKKEIKSDLLHLRNELKTDFRSEIHRAESRLDRSISNLGERIDILVDHFALRLVTETPKKRRRLQG